MIIKYFLYFIIYSFVGWCLEVTCKFFQYKRFINRGFLIGPLCTIYGYGVLAIVLLIGKDKSDILSVFLKAIFVCSILEYFTSYFMEKIFHAKWWDYSTKKFNLNGRICLDTMIPFGILGCLVVYIIHPVVVSLVEFIPSNLLTVIATLILLLFIIDNIVSFFITFKIKNHINDMNKDNTEYVREEVLKWINNNSILYRRLKTSYPNILINYKAKRNQRLEEKRKLENDIKRILSK